MNEVQAIDAADGAHAPAKGSDRRLTDRRRRPTRIFSRHTLFGGRRRAVRRTGESTAVYVDVLSPRVSIVLVSIFFFHCLDALFTLAHLARGGRELNPVMDYFLQQGDGVFVAVKLGMAGAGLCFLALHKNFPLAKAAIAGLFLLYAGVVGYHFVLILAAS